MEGTDKWAMLQNQTVCKHSVGHRNTLVCFSVLNLQANILLYHFLKLPSEVEFGFVFFFFNTYLVKSKYSFHNLQIMHSSGPIGLLREEHSPVTNPDSDSQHSLFNSCN